MNRTITYSEAISEAIVQNMECDNSVFVMGLGVTDFKGIFGTTKKANDLFPGRVIETPASENALTGIAIGSALIGQRPILVHARNDFMFLGLDQMINCASKWKYTSEGKSNVPIVVRAIVGKGWGQGPTHSQSLHSICAHFPGLKVMMPSTPYDVKGMLTSALKQDSPVLMVEHRSLYDTIGNVPENLFEVEIGKARVVREGSDITLVATSYLIGEAVVVADYLQKGGISVEIIDPRSVQPLDIDTIISSVQKTGRLICLDTSWLSCGFSSEISAQVAEKGFEYLQKPIKRIGLAECPCPVSKPLEDVFYPQRSEIAKACCELLESEYNIENIDEYVDTFLGPY